MNSQFNSNAMGAIAYLLLPLVFATFDLVQSPFSEKNAENLEKKVRKKIFQIIFFGLIVLVGKFV